MQLTPPIRGLLCAGLLSGLFCAAASTTYGQSAKPTRKPAKPPATSDTGSANAPGRATVTNPSKRTDEQAPEPQVSPQLEAVLVEWEKNSAKIQKLKGTFKRQSFDMVWGIERRAEGDFFYEHPDKGVYNVRGEKIAKGAVSKRVNKETNAPFKLEKDKEERWLCNGKEILQINDAEKTYEVVVIPEDKRGENIMEGPLPFLFGMKAEQAKRRYRLALTKETDTEVTIIAEPLWDSDRANYRKAAIMLAKPQYLPRKVYLQDPSANKDTYHEFDLKNMDINSRQALFAGNPLKPDLSRYKRIVTHSTAKPPSDEVVRPNGPSAPPSAPKGRIKPVSN